MKKVKKVMAGRFFVQEKSLMPDIAKNKKISYANAISTLLVEALCD